MFNKRAIISITNAQHGSRERSADLLQLNQVVLIETVTGRSGCQCQVALEIPRLLEP